MKALILIWSLLLPYMAFGQATSSDTQYRNDGETLINGSFEQGKKGYTFTVGSGSPVWSTQATTKLTGKAMQLTLSAQTFSFKSNTTQGSDLSGQNGYIEVYLSASASGAEFCPVVDGVSAPTTTPNECQPIIAGVGFKPYGIQKTFGASSLNYEIRGVSNASYTGAIYIDDGSVAKKSIVTQTSGAKKIGSIFYPQTASCGWSTSSATYVDFSADTDCATPVVTGSIKAPATKTPSFVIPSGSPPGTYYIVGTGAFYRDASNAYGSFRFNGGGVSSKGGSLYLLSSSSPTLSGTMDFSSNFTSDTTITIQARNASGNITISNDDSGIEGLELTVYYFPPQPISTINTSNGWFIDANIGGGNPNLGLTSIATYTEITSSSLDLVINTSKGSAPAEIACASGTASVGLTCNTPAVAESVGLAFIPPKTGKYRACFSFGNASGSSNVLIQTFQAVETSNTSSSIISEGGERVTVGGSVINLQNIFGNNKVCGNFLFNDTTKKTIRLQYEQQASSASQSLIIADRNTNNGQNDIHIFIEPIVENIQASLQGYNSTDGVVNPKIFSLRFGTGASCQSPCTTGTCIVCNQVGNNVTSVTFVSTGYYRLNGIDGTKYNCTATGNTGGGLSYGVPLFGNHSSTYLGMAFYTGATVANVGDANVICHGIP